jgi:hypothetical protein
MPGPENDFIMGERERPPKKSPSDKTGGLIVEEALGGTPKGKKRFASWCRRHRPPRTRLGFHGPAAPTSTPTLLPRANQALFIHNIAHCTSAA